MYMMDGDAGGGSALRRVETFDGEEGKIVSFMNDKVLKLTFPLILNWQFRVIEVMNTHVVLEDVDTLVRLSIRIR